jgi:RNA polymerase sigma-70 factor, ECF subfamily
MPHGRRRPHDGRVESVLTKLAGYPGQSMLTERAGPAGEPGPPGVTAPGVDGRELTDAEIIALSQHNPGPFSLLFERRAPELLRYVHARLGPDLAEDVLAETFLAAFRRRAHYDGSRADARPWLYGIAVREIARHRRAEARGRRALARIPAEVVTGDFGERSAERVTAQRLRPRLATVLADLPRQDRELLLLIAWAGLTYEETAQALGIPVTAVRSRLHRVRVKTRQALGGANPANATQEETGHG